MSIAGSTSAEGTSRVWNSRFESQAAWADPLTVPTTVRVGNCGAEGSSLESEEKYQDQLL